jgi:hypothetical protein
MKRTKWLYKSNNQALEKTNLNDNKTLKASSLSYMDALFCLHLQKGQAHTINHTPKEK